MNQHWSQRKLLLDKDAFATSLFLLVADKFGLECLEWAPTSLYMECKDTWSCDVPTANIGKIMAAIGLVTTDYFYTSLPAFINTCNALYGYTELGSFDPADPDEILMGVTEALLLWPPDSKDKVFSEEISAYIDHTFRSHGSYKPIGILGAVMSSNNVTGFADSFSDDPEMFESIYSAHQSRRNDIQQQYIDNVNALIEELGTLRLQNGTTQEAQEQLRTVLGFVSQV
jgi:hypothetical protein